jgi:hypothetical protein
LGRTVARNNEAPQDLELCRLAIRKAFAMVRIADAIE